ncbi:MAG: sodium:proton antiporter NhaD [Candidatus Kapaibacterium sp.]
MEIIILLLVVAGYVAITLEGSLKLDKTATALLSGLGCWILIFIAPPQGITAETEFMHHLSEIAAVILFLLGAMTIVELIDRHHGFDAFVRLLITTSLPALVVRVAVASFFLSALLDNLTTTIAMCAIIRRIVAEREQRLWIAALIVITANAGGAWSPMGDVTTSMLWIGGQLSTTGVMLATFVPSLAVAAVPTLYCALRWKGTAPLVPPSSEADQHASPAYSSKILMLGTAMFLLVPLLAALYHIPPVVGMLFALSLMWISVTLLHRSMDESERNRLGVAQAMRNIDTPTILFFAGLLLSVSALSVAGFISSWASWLAANVPAPSSVAVLLGLASSVIDNIPLVAASQKMFSMQTFGMDHPFWNLLALTTGTGGSIIIFGSAAGVAVMGMEDMRVGWYTKRISLLALSGFAAGALVFMAMNM